MCRRRIRGCSKLARCVASCTQIFLHRLPGRKEQLSELPDVVRGKAIGRAIGGEGIAAADRGFVAVVAAAQAEMLSVRADLGTHFREVVNGHHDLAAMGRVVFAHALEGVLGG